MTKVYNVTTVGIANQLEESFEILNIDKQKLVKVPTTNGNFLVYLTRKELFQIAKLINEQIFILFPSLNYIYTYFINVSKLLLKLKLRTILEIIRRLGLSL